MRGAYAGDGDEGLEMAGPALVYYPSLTRAGAAFHNTAQHFLWADIDAGWLARMELCARLPVKPGVVANAHILKLAAGLNASALGAGDANPMELESAVYELLSALTDGAEDVNARPHWWRDALNILHENENAIGLVQTAEALQLHPSHLARAFKAHAGCAIGEYSRRVRLSRAAHDLVHTNKTVSDIAAERGFFDQSHFNRHFKRGFGYAPSQYRILRS